MPATIVTITDADVTFLLDGEVAPATSYKCQVVQAQVTANPNLQDVPATFCQPATQTPAATGFQLDLIFLQDWTDPNGLSFFLFDHDTELAEVTVNLNDSAQPSAVGDVRLVAGAFGGAAGTPLQATVTLPYQGKPVITPPAATLAARRGVVDADVDADVEATDDEATAVPVS